MDAELRYNPGCSLDYRADCRLTLALMHMPPATYLQRTYGSYKGTGTRLG